MGAPGLSAVEQRLHRQLADVWRADRPLTPPRARWCSRAPGRRSPPAAASSSSRHDPRATASATRVMREARDLVLNVIKCSKPIVSAMHGPRSGRAGGRDARRHLGRSAATPKIIDGHTRLGVAAGDHAAICWPLLCGMAKASTASSPATPLTGEEAERIGLGVVVRGRRPGPGQCPGGSRRNWPRAGPDGDPPHASTPLNNWYRQRGRGVRRLAASRSSTASAALDAEGLAQPPGEATPAVHLSVRPGGHPGEVR